MMYQRRENKRGYFLLRLRPLSSDDQKFFGKKTGERVLSAAEKRGVFVRGEGSKEGVHFQFEGGGGSII